MGHPLRPWQRAALVAVAERWTHERAALVVAATGVGKARCIAEIVKRSRDKGRGRVLVTAPLISLVDQLSETITAHGVSCEAEQADRMASLYPGLFGGSDCVVACSATMVGRRLARWPVEAFARIVVDEAHEAAGAADRALLAHFHGAKVVGFTATPDAATLGVYGPPTLDYGIEAGIRDGVLCPVQSRAIRLDTVSLDRIQLEGKDLDAEELGRAFGATRETILSTCAVVNREAGNRQTIAFLPTVAAAHAYRYEMGGLVGPDLVDSLDGTTPQEHRRKALDRFRRGELRYLFCCALLTTGVDLPMASCIAVLRPTKSTTLFRQMVGRGLRTHPGKADCLVLTTDWNVPDLRSTVDLFEELPEAIRAQAHRAIMAGEDALRVVSGAQERAQAHRDRLERARAAQVQVQVAAQVIVTDLFRAAGVPEDPRLAGGPRCTEGQVAYLRKQYGMKLSSKQVSQKMYRALVEPLKERQRRGLCTLAQSRVLVKHGLPGDLSFDDARLALDALAVEKGWRTA